MTEVNSRVGESKVDAGRHSLRLRNPADNNIENNDSLDKLVAR
jgi:hypothetical protein